MLHEPLPNPLIAFGSNETCNLDNCPVQLSILSYRPWLAANIVFAAYFAVAGLVHVYLGWRWRSWGFMIGILLGCTTEVIGYAGRIIMWHNPFSYPGFIIQIVCLTIGPVFYTGSIYITLSKTINFCGPELSRFPPKLFYFIFIPFDIVCLVLQAAGGGLSTGHGSTAQSGVNISIAGLALQVFVILVFTIAFGDYIVRYMRRVGLSGGEQRFLVFIGGLMLATLLILTRCGYRVAELQSGYNGELFHKEVPFVILEGVMIALAVVALAFGHPGLVLSQRGLGKRHEKFLQKESVETVDGVVINANSL